MLPDIRYTCSQLFTMIKWRLSWEWDRVGVDDVEISLFDNGYACDGFQQNLRFLVLGMSQFYTLLGSSLALRPQGKASLAV